MRGPDSTVAGGVAIALSSAFLWSITGILIRFVEDATTPQVIIVRSLAMAGGLALFIGLRYRGRAVQVVLGVGWAGIIAGVLLGCGFVSYLSAITRTTIANVSFLTCLVPFTTALLARAVLGEQVLRRTWWAIGVAVVGVAIMVADGIAVGGLVGMGFSLAAATMQSAYTVVLRYARGVDMVPVLCLAALIAGVFGAMLGGDPDVTWHDGSFIVAAGLISTAFGNIVYIAATRRMPAAELALLSLLEVVLSPLWVWLVIDETPTPQALAGGLIVLGAVVWQALGGRAR